MAKKSKGGASDNPMRPDKKVSPKENFKKANPYLKSKGKKASKSEKGKNPMKG